MDNRFQIFIRDSKTGKASPINIQYETNGRSIFEALELQYFEQEFCLLLGREVLQAIQKLEKDSE